MEQAGQLKRAMDGIRDKYRKIHDDTMVNFQWQTRLTRKAEQMYRDFSDSRGADLAQLGNDIFLLNNDLRKVIENLHEAEKNG